MHTICRSSRIPPESSRRRLADGRSAAFQSSRRVAVLDLRFGAGTAFLGAGSTPLLGASLAQGATDRRAGLPSGSLKNRLVNGYLNPAAFTPAPVFDPTNCAIDPELLRDRIRRSRPQYLPRAFPAELGCVVPQAFQDWGAEGCSLRGGLLQPLEPHELRGSNGDRRRDSWSRTNSPFGKIIQTNGNPRLIQFSLRWAF